MLGILLRAFMLIAFTDSIDRDLRLKAVKDTFF